MRKKIAEYISKLGIFNSILLSVLPINPNIWSNYFKDFSNRSYDPSITSLRQTGDFRWELKMSPSDWSGTDPVYKDGMMYIAGSPGNTGIKRKVYAINIETGSTLWEKQLDDVYGHQLLINDRVLVILANSDIYFLNLKNGELIYKVHVPGNFIKGTLYQNSLYVFASDHSALRATHLYKINFLDKRVDWKVEYKIVSGNIDYPIPIDENKLILSSTEAIDGDNSWFNLEYSDISPGSCKTGYCRNTLAVYTNIVKRASPDSTVYVSNNLLVRKLSAGEIGFFNFKLGENPKIELINTYRTYMTSGVVANNQSLFFLEKDAEISNNIFLHEFSYLDNIVDKSRVILQDTSIENGLLHLLKPIISDNNLFFHEKGRFGFFDGKSQYRWHISSIDLKSGMRKSYPFHYSYLSYNPQRLFHFDGIFVTKMRYNVYQAFSISGYQKISITSPYSNNENKNQYLGQIHAHHKEDVQVYNYSPYEVAKRYKDNGYDFIALTEHNELTPDPLVEGITYINMAEEDTQGHGGNHILAIGTNDLVDETKSDQERIDNIANQSGFSSLAHPNSYAYQWTSNEMLSLDGYQAIEIYNSQVSKIAKNVDYLLWLKQSGNFKNSAYSLDKFDHLISKGKNTFLTAGDDYTPIDPGGFDGGAIVVWADSNNQSDILNAMKQGNFYALKGGDAARFNKIEVIDNKILVEIDDDEDILFIGYNGKILKTAEDTLRAEYEIEGYEKYVRVQIGKKRGETWSQPIYIDKIYEEFFEGGRVRNESDQFFINTQEKIAVKALGQKERPIDLPPGGYLSEVFKITENYSLVPVNAIFKIPSHLSDAGVKNLFLYSRNKASNEWVKLDSIIDYSLEMISANIDSGTDLIVISTSLVNDTTPPVIIDISTNTDTVNFLVEDNESSVIGVNAYKISNNSELDVCKDGDDYKIDSHGEDIVIFTEDEYGNRSSQVIKSEIASGEEVDRERSLQNTVDNLNIKQNGDNSYTNQIDTISPGNYIDQLKESNEITKNISYETEKELININLSDQQSDNTHIINEPNKIEQFNDKFIKGVNSIDNQTPLMFVLFAIVGSSIIIILMILMKKRQNNN